jgi:hypothetical protein
MATAKPVSTLLYWKYNMQGERVAKARTVFSGRDQVRGHDYDLSSSHTPRWTTVRCHLGLQPKGDPTTQVLTQFDIKKFFCHAKNETVSGHRVVVRLPIQAQYSIDGRTYKYAVCETALYGQKNAGFLSERMLWKHMVDHGWKQGYDPCSWTRGQSRIIWWVDDGLYRGPAAERDQCLAELEKTFPGMSQSDATFYLGHHVTLDHDGTVSISAEQAIQDLCSRHNIGPTITKEAPLTPGTVPTKLEGDPVPALRTPTQQIVGSLSYLSTTVRVDISYATSTLSRVSHSPNAKQHKAALHTVKYLNGTANLGLSWKLQSEANRNVPECYVDASYADADGFKSTTGYLVMLNGAPISWASKTQKFVTTSSTEAEIVAACDAAKECAFIKALLDSWSSEHWPCKVDRPIVCHEDNQAAIHWFENGLMSNRAKHFGTRIYYIRDQLGKNQLIHFQHISTHDQLADALTKSLASKIQSKHTDKMLCSIFRNRVHSIMTTCP